MRVDQAVNIEDLHRMAKRRLPKVAFDFIEGGLEDERGLEFFKVHERADVWHARSGEHLLRQHCATSRDGELAIDPPWGMH